MDTHAGYDLCCGQGRTPDLQILTQLGGTPRNVPGASDPGCETLGQNKRPGSSDAPPAGQCSPCARSMSELGKSIHPDLLLPRCGKKVTAVSISVHKDKAMPIRVDKFVPIACLRLAPRLTLGIRTLGYGEGLAASVLNSSSLDKAEVTFPYVVSVTSLG